MSQDDLRQFFGQVLKEEGFLSSESFAIFGKLVRLTLQYRDRLLAETGEIFTVGETRQALNAYMITLEIGRLPENLDTKIADLVRLWLKEINGKSY